MLLETYYNLQIFTADKEIFGLVKGHSKVKSQTHRKQERNIKS